MRLWSRLLPGRRKRERGTGGDRIDSRSSSATGEPAGTSSRRANRYENNQRFRPEQIVQPTIEGAGIDSRIRLELDMQERRSRLRMEEMERRSMLRMEEMERRSRLEQDERDRRLRLQMEETERRLKLEMEELDRRLRVRMEEMNQSNVVRERQQYGLTSPNYVSSYNAQPPIIIQQPPPQPPYFPPLSPIHTGQMYTPQPVRMPYGGSPEFILPPPHELSASPTINPYGPGYRETSAVTRFLANASLYRYVPAPDDLNPTDGLNPIASPEWEARWEPSDLTSLCIANHNASCMICGYDFVAPRRALNDNESQWQSIVEDTQAPEPLRRLPCRHVYHQSCIENNLRNSSDQCPACRRRVGDDNASPVIVVPPSRSSSSISYS